MPTEKLYLNEVEERQLIEATHKFAELLVNAVVDPEQHKKAIPIGNKAIDGQQPHVENAANAEIHAATDYARYKDGSILGGDGRIYVSYENYQNTRKEVLEKLIESLTPGNLINNLTAAKTDQILPEIYAAPGAAPAAAAAHENYSATTTRAAVALGNAHPNSTRSKITAQGVVINDFVKSILEKSFAENVLPKTIEYINKLSGVNFSDPRNVELSSIVGFATKKAYDKFITAFDNPAITNLLDISPVGKLEEAKNELRGYTNPNEKLIAEKQFAENARNEVKVAEENARKKEEDAENARNKAKTAEEKAAEDGATNEDKEKATKLTKASHKATEAAGVAAKEAREAYEKAEAAEKEIQKNIGTNKANFGTRSNEIADAIATYVFTQLNSVSYSAADIIKNSLKGFVIKADLKTIAGPISADKIILPFIPDAAMNAAKELTAKSPNATAQQILDAARAAFTEIDKKFATANSNNQPIATALRIQKDIANATVTAMEGLGQNPATAALLAVTTTPTDAQKHNYLEGLINAVKETANTNDPEKAKDPEFFGAMKSLSGVILKNYGKDVFSNTQLTSLQGNIDSLLDVLDKASQNPSNKKVPFVLSVLGAGISALGVQLGTQKDFTGASIGIIVFDVVAAIATPLIAHYAFDAPKNEKTETSSSIANELKSILADQGNTKAIQFGDKVASIDEKFHTSSNKIPTKFASFVDMQAASRAKDRGDV